MSIEFRTQGVVRKIQSMSDKGMRVVFDTQELSVAEVAALYQYAHRSSGMVLTASELVREAEGEAPDVILEEGEKSPSQRLRSVLFLVWKEKGGKEDFDLYYRRTMNAIIDQFKSKLPAQ